MPFFRRANQVVRERRDGRFDVILPAPAREAVEQALDEIDELLDQPDLPVLARLSPPAYTDDDENNLAWQLIAGEELRTARREAIATVRRIHEQSVATDEDLWSWMRALNTLRLVLGTTLGIEDDDDSMVEVDEDAPARPLWEMYQLATVIQYEIVTALRG